MSASRTMRLTIAAFLVTLAVPGFGKPAAAGWRQIITQRDKTRLRNWRITWVAAVKEAQAHGFAKAIDAQGALLQPDIVLDHPELPDGMYRCRTFKLGTQPAADATPSPRSFSEFPAGHCRVGEHMLTRLDGVQRPSGRLYDYDGSRLLFLGGMALSDEAGPVRYQRDSERALVGLVERIGPARWRLVVPQPAWESRLDVMELVPEQG